MNESMKIVGFGALVLLSGSAFIEFGMFWIGGTLAALGAFCVIFGPLLLTLKSPYGD